ncbi:DJ-1/PfpI family protein [Alcaligenaceae bacterium SJ-26]|nr:DJ-1/PfpI family protein [Alcaligenaceae bacterium SJ-26]
MQVNILLFPAVTQLDLTGPYEVLVRAPGVHVDLVAASMVPVRSDRGLTLLPTVTMAQARPCDLLVVPGGPGADDALLDPQWVEFTARQGAQARYIFGICTGSLLLGAAGLLRDRRAASHWLARELLAEFGAIPVDSRLCMDGNIFTSGGVTSGIDMAIQVIASLFDEDTARQIQLQIEYDPAPPFPGGTPATSPAHIVQRCREAAGARQAIRAEAVAQAARALRERS